VKQRKHSRPRLGSGGLRVLVVVTALVSWTGLAGLNPGSAAAAASDCWATTLSDVDGGGPDAIVGLPSYDLPGKRDAGAIVVYSNVGAAAGESAPRAPSTKRLLTADDFPGLTAQAGARFGEAVVVWTDDHVDADHCADLLVGAPGENVGGQAGAGEVYLISGSAKGLSTVRTTFNEDNLNKDGVTGGAQAGAAFGSAIASETLSSIIVGAPGRDIGTATDAGHVVHVHYLLIDDDPEVFVIEQGRSGAGSPETGDRFGEVLDLLPTGDGDMLLFGIPHEDVGNKADAGAVALLPPSGALTMVTQDSAGAGGTAEAGDRYGAAINVYVTFTAHPVGIVVVGIPGEDVGSTKDAGAVGFASFDFSSTPEEGVEPLAGRARILSQDSAAIPGAVEAGDAFGSAVVTGEFGADNGERQIAISAPGEDLPGGQDAGMVSVTRTDENGKPASGAQPGGWTQDSARVSGAVERGDRFGAAASWVQLDRGEDDDDVVWPVLMLTVPGEDVGSVVNAGMAYLGLAPGKGSVPLTPPSLQAGAGDGMVGMQIAIGQD